MFVFFIVLSVLQGVTEFLPISSSGHLAFVQNLSFFQMQKTMVGKEVLFSYDVFIHLATFLSIVIFFYKDLIRIIGNDLKYLKGKRDEGSKSDMHLTLFIIVANIPVILVGLFFKDVIMAQFQHLQNIFFLFIINGLILISTYFIKTGKITMAEMGWFRAIAIGFGQSLAILPGISRSGTTISVAFHLKMNPEDSARFSFLLGLPVIFGAFLLEFIQILKVPGSFPFTWEIVIGMVLAFLTGLASLRILLWLVKRTVLYPFGIYTLLLGIVGIYFIMK